MDFRIGEQHTCMQYDIGELRNVEILFVYKENIQEPELDIILYRYYGEYLECWIYKAHRRFEVERQIRKAYEEKEYSDSCAEYYAKNPPKK